MNLINPHESPRYHTIMRILAMTESDYNIIKRIVECIVPMTEDSSIQDRGNQRVRKFSAAQVAGKYKHSKTSTETIMKNRRDEVELEEEKLKRLFGGNE